MVDWIPTQNPTPFPTVFDPECPGATSDCPCSCQGSLIFFGMVCAGFGFFGIVALIWGLFCCEGRLLNPCMLGVVRRCCCRCGNRRFLCRWNWDLIEDLGCIQCVCHNDPLHDALGRRLGFHNPWALVRSGADVDATPTLGTTRVGAADDALLEEYADAVIESYTPNEDGSEEADDAELYRRWSQGNGTARAAAPAAVAASTAPPPRVAWTLPTTAPPTAASFAAARQLVTDLAANRAAARATSARATARGPGGLTTTREIAAAAAAAAPVNIFDRPSTLGLFGTDSSSSSGGGGSSSSSSSNANSSTPAAFQEPIPKQWYFIDGAGDQQGPCTTKQMRAWKTAGFFFDDTQVAPVSEDPPGMKLRFNAYSASLLA